MKKTTITALVASAFILTPALADDKAKKAENKPAAAAQSQAKPQKRAKTEKNTEKKVVKKVEKKCLDTEIQNLESALDNIGKAVGQRMEKQTQELAQSQAALAKAKAECEQLKKKLAASEATSKKAAQTFAVFKTESEKQRKMSMASLAKASEATKGHEKIILELKKKNAACEAHCKAACERLKAIVGNLKKVEDELAAAKQ